MEAHQHGDIPFIDEGVEEEQDVCYIDISKTNLINHYEMKEEEDGKIVGNNHSVLMKTKTRSQRNQTYLMLEAENTPSISRLFLTEILNGRCYNDSPKNPILFLCSEECSK